jgi:hypothetical protein
MNTSNYFIKYQLKEDDTPQSVAKKLNIDLEYLILVHNLNVKIEERITDSKVFSKHLKEIFVTDEVLQKFVETENNKRLRNSQVLIYKPIKDKKEYEVFYKYTDGSDPITITYQASVVSIEGNLKQTGHIIEIDRISSPEINDEAPASAIDELAVATAKVIYPLQIILDTRGKWIAINNYEEIVKRWQIIKEKVQDEFESRWVESYVLETENTLKNEDVLFNSLKKDWFLRTFFVKIYTDYYSQYILRNTSISFPIISSMDDFQYSVIQEMTKYADDVLQLTVSQKGKLRQNIESIEEEIDGQFEATYLLDPMDNSIKKVKLNCSVGFTLPKKVSVKITLLETKL